MNLLVIQSMLYGSSILANKREKIAYYINESRNYICEPCSDELPIDGAEKRLTCSYHEYDKKRNGKTVPIYTTSAIYENNDTGFFKRYWFCTEKYNDNPLSREPVSYIRHSYKNGSSNIRVGTDLSGNPIVMTCYFDMYRDFVSDVTYTCCGYTTDSYIKHAVQISGNLYALLLGDGIILVNKATGKYRKAFDGNVCYYNTRLVKTSRKVINTIKRVLPKKGR